MIKMYFTDMRSLLDIVPAKDELFRLKNAGLVKAEKMYGNEYTDIVTFAFSNDSDELAFKLKFGEHLRLL
jgi:hypothetical protein